MTTFRTKLSRALRNFRTARAGNVAIIFAAAAVPVLGAVGAAYDYSHANAVKAAMQAALDSTALMLSKQTSGLSDGADMSSDAKKFFTALFSPHAEATNITISAVYHSTGGSSVVVNGSVDVPTTFVRIFDFGTANFDNIKVGGSSTAAWGSNRLRVALALDNTGSMADAGKMTALKLATKGLLTQLQTAAGTNGDVYVSIIPFSKDVNVGSSNYNASWIDWSDWDDDNGHDSSTTTCTTTSPGKKWQDQEEMHHVDHLGSGQSQHVERLHYRSRPRLRPVQRRADRQRVRQSVEAVPGRAV